MSDPIDFIYCKLPDTPRWFDKSKFKDGDASQKELYSKSKKPDMDSLLTYEQICDKTKKYNYARFVPKGCVYLDFDNKTEAEKILEIIRHSKLKCLVLKTVKGYHFLFRIPKLYKSQMTGATNWFGYKFDTKGVIDKEKAIQIIRVCGMDREERISWDWDAGPIEPPECINTEALDVLPYWLWGKLKDIK